MRYKIVSDSSCDLLTLEDVAFSSVPMKVSTNDKEYTDDENLNLEAMLKELLEYKGRSYTACPNIDEWLEAFSGADNIFVVTITSGLSGSFSSAVSAKKIAESQDNGKHIFVIDTLSAGPEMLLIVEKLRELILAENTFEDIVSAITEYQKHTHLLFALESLHNFVQNGRVSRVAALAAGTLGIRALGTASEEGKLEMLSKHRGANKTIYAITSEMKAKGYDGKTVRIGHTANEKDACALKEMILNQYPNADIKIYHMRGLCSYYAEKGGILVGFED